VRRRLSTLSNQLDGFGWNWAEEIMRWIDDDAPPECRDYNVDVRQPVKSRREQEYASRLRLSVLLYHF
jgi:hypothetical protein